MASCEMINGVIEEQMRGIQIVAKPINQRNCAPGGGSTMRNLVSVQAGAVEDIHEIYQWRISRLMRVNMAFVVIRVLKKPW